MQDEVSTSGVGLVKCNKCQESRDWNGGVGWKGKQCPECTRAYNRKRHAADPEPGRAKFRRWKEANPEQVRELQRNAKRKERGRPRTDESAEAETGPPEQSGGGQGKASKMPIPQKGSQAPAPPPLSPRCEVCRKALVYYPDSWIWFCQGCWKAKAVRQ